MGVIVVTHPRCCIVHTSPCPANHEAYAWCATYDNYDGAPDSSTRGHVGYGATEDEATADLLANYEPAP